MRIEVVKAVVETLPREVAVRPPLYADKCDACGKVFQMRECSGNVPTARMHGIFDRGANRGSNQFSAEVCSFACAHELFANGGWRRLPSYQAFVDADANLHRVELAISNDVRWETELRESWESKFPVGSK